MHGCTPSLHLLLILEVFRGGCWSHVCILTLAASLGLTLPTASRFYLRDGGASSEDLKNFPARLKRKLIVVHWGGVSFLLILFGLWAVDALGLV